MLNADETRRELVWRYVGAGLVHAIAFCLRYILFRIDPNFDSGFFVFAGVLIAAWLGGIGPALLWQTVILFAHAGLLLDDVSPAEGLTLEVVIGGVSFYALGIVLGALSEARRGALRRVRCQSEQIAKQDEELRAMIASIGDALVVVDHQGRINYLNPVAERLTQWPLNDALRMPVDQVFCFAESGVAARENLLLSALSTGESTQDGCILKLQARDGRQTPVTYNATPIRSVSGISAGTVIVLRDESTRLEAEDQLRDMNARKDDFLATLAHELRNPLAPLRTGLQLLKMSDDDPEAASEVREIMERQVMHIIRLVDDLLDVSRISRGKLQLRTAPTNLSRVVADAVETMRPQFEEAGHQVTVELPSEPKQVDADPDRLTQIACNLLHNAIKFTPRGGRIEVRLEQEKDMAELVVADSGQGIRHEYLDSIFEMFNQGMLEKERGKMGLGVGLTLARRLAEMHGGTIVAESAGPNLGSTFRLRLPIQQRFAVVPPPLVSEGQTKVMRRRILVVDDNEDALRTLELMLRALGHETKVARNGQEAVEVARDYEPQVIFMDLGMPLMSGYEAAPLLREALQGKTFTLIALSGWGQEGDRLRTQAAGFDDHLVKPIGLETLKSCLEREPAITSSKSPLLAAI